MTLTNAGGSSSDEAMKGIAVARTLTITLVFVTLLGLFIKIVLL